MIHNLLRSGYVFSPDETELETKYIMTMLAAFTSAFFLLALSLFFYFTGDTPNTTIHSIGLILILSSIFIYRIVGKENYHIAIYFATGVFFVLIMYAHYALPMLQPTSAWITLQVLASFLIFGIQLAVWVSIVFSVSAISLNYMAGEHSMQYMILHIAPPLLALFFIYVIHKKFQKNMQLLAEANTLLEERIEERTQELEADKIKLSHQAHYDDLTNLPNRLLLKEALEARMKGTRDLSLFIIDLDGFKKINDVFGHAYGDKVLKIIASRLNKIKEKEDFLARMSGDEFVFVSHVENTGLQKDIAYKILAEVEKPIQINNKTILISSSIGICGRGSDMHTMEQIITCADIAMYEAKRKGRGNFKFYTHGMMESMERKLKLETEMKQAFKEDAFVLHYQPQIDVVKNEICCIEALVRWKHKDRGLLLPHEFIDTAEEIDMIPDLDYHVLSKGILQISSWLKLGYALPRVSFNISGKHLQEDFYIYIKDILEATACPPKYLELEITEGYFVSDTARAISMLQKLQKLGIHIAVDDFGKGYSSLSYLKNLPINKIKIDKLFIDTVHTDNVDAIIVNSVINIANSLEIQVVAEGVETKDQISYLLNAGCRYVQGHHYYKAMDAEKLENILQKEKKI